MNQQFRVYYTVTVVITAFCNCRLPVLPSEESISKVRSDFTEKSSCLDKDRLIPCHVWVTGRDLSQNRMPSHLKSLMNRNKDWEFHLIDDKMMKRFLKHVFRGTGVLWAYEHISHQLGASRADLWRLAVLWIHGGIYIDLDADITTPFREMVSSNDSYLLSTEGNRLGQCYKPSFHLNQSVKNCVEEWYKGKSMLQWIIVSKPNHLFLRRALENIVELVTLEFKRQSVIEYESHEGPVMAVFCCTGPNLYTTSVLEVINEHHKNVSYRYIGQDFQRYGGQFKATGFRDGDLGPRYVNLMNHGKVPFLRKYENSN